MESFLSIASGVEGLGERFQQIWTFPLIKMGDGASISMSQIVLAIVFTIVGLLLARLAERLAKRHLKGARLSVDAANTAGRLTFYALAIVVALTALKLLHIPITALTFLSGAVAIGVGFGAQNIINNFISGWILMSERPVRVGDFIELEDYRGVIENVGNRSTQIRRTDGVTLLVPNSLMLERTLVNWTLVDDDFRTTIRVGVAYGSPTRKVEELLLQAAKDNPHVQSTPPPQAIFEDFGDNALVFDLYVWLKARGEKDIRSVRSDIRHRIVELFHEASIVIAFPQRDVHMDNLSPLDIRLLKE